MVSNQLHFSFSFISGNRKKSQGVKSWEYGGWGMTAISCFARNYWMRTEVWDGALSWWSSQVCSRQSSGRRLRTFSPQNVAVEIGIHSSACWNRCFAIQQLLYRWWHQSGIFWIPPLTGFPLNTDWCKHCLHEIKLGGDAFLACFFSLVQLRTQGSDL
jgi:hypothetical protein